MSAARRPAVLVICSDRIAPQMAGTGIRAHQLARALRPHADVVLAGITGSVSPDADTPVVEYRLPDPRALHGPIAAADVIVAQPHWPGLMARMRASRARLIFDLYAPEVLEALETFAGHAPPVRGLLGALITDRLIHALHIGHHFLCASEKQRDLWTGVMMGERLLSFETYRRDPSLDSLFRVVPFGVDDAPPPAGTATGPRERFPAIGAREEIILWNGGLWGWFDPLTAVRGFAALHERRPAARLVFMGAAGHPQARRATLATTELARALGLLDRAVFLNDEWVPYAERGGWLLASDCAVSTHVDQLETRYSFRTRLLDCFWAGLPIACTGGDALADRVGRDRLGEVVPPSDPAALAAALERVLDRGRAAYGPALAAAADELRWARVTLPLVDLVTGPAAAPRLGDSLAGRTSTRGSHRLRAATYRTARATLNAAGLTDWPKLGPR